ncbi:hypothetical protein ACFHW2_42825 [Actinomadura sp. LOL_016]|uniref:hypothetical protein n=1 Tax=unclassified Actinomadura TaxID=2626254 RepID=UPI003A8074B0
MTIPNTAPDWLDQLTGGPKMIVNFHNAGLMSPNDANNGRHHVQAWREQLTKHKGYHRWQLAATEGGHVTIQNVSSSRYVEPVRKSEDKAEYDNTGWGAWVWLEKGSPAGARQQWTIWRYGELYMFVLKDTEYAIGLRDLSHSDSHLDLFDALYTSRNLWWIADA